MTHKRWFFPREPRRFARLVLGAARFAEHCRLDGTHRLIEKSSGTRTSDTPI